MRPLIVLTLLIGLADEAPGLEPFLWPLQADPGLAASFCEFRSRHFHGGVDVKTWGVRSRSCVAVDDGVVSRVKVQAAGYGKALYLTLRDGRTAVYAHLDRFAPQVTERVRAVQEATGNFEVDLFWEGDSAIPFKRGDVVAFSGVSGTVHPHLHFEIRDARQGPLNPLTNGLYVADHIAPVPVALGLTPLDGASTVEGDFQPRLYTRLLREPGGGFTPGDPIGASGRIGVSLDAYDQADAASNEMAAYKIELDVAGETYWTTEYDGFEFDQTRMIEVERDYRIMRRGKGVYHRLYRVPGNRLRLSSGDGVLDAGLADPYPIDVKITLSDAAGNSSQLVFAIVSDMIEDTSRGVGGQPLVHPDGWSQRSRDAVAVDWFDGYLRLAAPPGVASFSIAGPETLSLGAMLVNGGVAAAWTPRSGWDGAVTIAGFNSLGKKAVERVVGITRAVRDQRRVVVSDDSLCLLEIPPMALYDDLWLDLEREDGFDIPGEVEGVYRVEPRDQPVARSVRVKIRRAETDADRAGWGVYYFHPRYGWSFLGRDEEDGFLTGDATSFDRFGLLFDDEPPTIAISQPRVARDPDPRFEFAAVIKDRLSGISSSGIVVRLDGRKIPAEYDQPRARVYYRPWKPLAAGEHLYEIEVTDRAGNSAKRTVSVSVNGGR